MYAAIDPLHPVPNGNEEFLLSRLAAGRIGSGRAVDKAVRGHELPPTVGSGTRPATKWLLRGKVLFARRSWLPTRL